jgi:hypothetical protein
VGDLVDFLGPAFGGGSLGESFAAATLVVFSTSGFLAFYLVTRIYLGRVFAQADSVMNLKKEIAEVRVTQLEQTKRDVDALTLVARQLDEPKPGAPSIAQKDLNEAVAAASRLVKSQIFTLARQQRRLTLKINDKPSMERTIPVFHALIESEGEVKFHKNHSQLGYALKDRAQPDLPGAVAALTEAIDLRDKKGDRGFLLYEFNRALARIQQEPNPPSEVRKKIEADLQVARANTALMNQIDTNQDIKKFLDAAPPLP